MELDSRVADPLLAPVQTETEDDEPPPPSAQHGINLLLPGTQSIGGATRAQFGLDHAEPGLLRFRNGQPLCADCLIFSLDLRCKPNFEPRTRSMASNGRPGRESTLFRQSLRALSVVFSIA